MEKDIATAQRVADDFKKANLHAKAIEIQKNINNAKKSKKALIDNKKSEANKKKMIEE